jgi:hypothetical protein
MSRIAILNPSTWVAIFYYVLRRERITTIEILRYTGSFIAGAMECENFI